MFTPEDFDLEIAPFEMVQYVIDNVDCFSGRYAYAIDVIGEMRCPLQMADGKLYDDIAEAIGDWCYDNGLDPDDYDIEEIFG